MVNYPIFGRQLLNGIFSQGSWFGEISVLDNGGRPHDAIAAGRTVLARIPLAAWQLLVSETPDFILDLARLNCTRARNAVKTFNALMIYSSEARLARLLLLLSGPATGRGPLPEMHLSQSDLGDMIGATRQIVNKLLRHFEGEGIIEAGYARIRILAPERLQAFLPVTSAL